MAQEKWYFTKEQLANTPSRRAGLDADKELSYRQQAANFIQDMGQRLVVYPFDMCKPAQCFGVACSFGSLSLPSPSFSLAAFSILILLRAF